VTPDAVEPGMHPGFHERMHQWPQIFRDAVANRVMKWPEARAPIQPEHASSEESRCTQ